MRLAVGTILIERGAMTLWSGPSMELTVLSVLAMGAGLLLLAGLWTPVAGAVVAATEVCKIFLKPDSVWIYILLGAFGAALAMVGPGAWSIDARLFGRKHIGIRDD